MELVARARRLIASGVIEMPEMPGMISINTVPMDEAAEILDQIIADPRTARGSSVRIAAWLARAEALSHKCDYDQACSGLSAAAEELLPVVLAGQLVRGPELAHVLARACQIGAEAGQDVLGSAAELTANVLLVVGESLGHATMFQLVTAIDDLGRTWGPADERDTRNMEVAHGLTTATRTLAAHTENVELGKWTCARSLEVIRRLLPSESEQTQAIAARAISETTSLTCKLWNASQDVAFAATLLELEALLATVLYNNGQFADAVTRVGSVAPLALALERQFGANPQFAKALALFKSTMQDLRITLDGPAPRRAGPPDDAFAPVRSAYLHMLGAHSRAELMSMLEESISILTPETDFEVEAWAARQRSDDNAAQIMKLLAFVGRAREGGLAAAAVTVDWVPETLDESDPSTRTTRALEALMYAPTKAALRAVIAKYPELLEPATVGYLISDDERLAARLAGLRNLLLRCRIEGVEAAFALEG
ncbi:MAG: hypothetical protein IPJ34_13165 [Myxococcales bacterium]|nr:hypothetical protein [Myxococcales bacterium]